MKENLDVLHKMIDMMEDGKEKLDALAEAIKTADEAGSPYHQMVFRFEYVAEAVFHDDPVKALPAMAEFSRIYEENPNVFGENGGDIYLITMDYGIDSIASLPQIPLNQWEQLLEQFHMLTKRFNLAQRSYLTRLCQYYMQVHKEKALECFEKLWHTERDDLSDCEACEHCIAVRVHLLADDVEGAAKYARPLENGSLEFCSHTPHRLYRDYIEYALNHGDLQMAVPYAKKLMPIGRRDKADLSYMGACLRAYAYFDTKTAIEIMEQGLPWTVNMWDKKYVYDFYKGAWTVLRRLARTETQITLSLPPELPVYRRDNSYSVKELADWFMEQITEIAGQFDARNKNNYFAEDLQQAQIVAKWTPSGGKTL